MPYHPAALILITSAVLLGAPLQAQIGFRLHSIHDHIPRAVVSCDYHCLQLEDLDGDGHPDLVIGAGRSGAPNDVLMNKGGAHFEAAVSPSQLGTSRAMEIVVRDFDADGDLDIFFMNWGEQHRLFLNDGAGLFTDVTATHLPWNSRLAMAANAGDVDGDGDIDLVIATERNSGRVYRNNGQGVFSVDLAAFASWPVSPTRCQALADVDGDGDLDVVIGIRGRGRWNRNELFLNNGIGKFTAAVSTQFPVYSAPTTDLGLIDFDGDGDRDLLITGDGAEHIGLFINDGTGTFVDETATRLNATAVGLRTVLTAGDFDGDGDTDVVLAGDSIQLLSNNGNGKFTVSTIMKGVVGAAVGAADVDGDGDLDLVMVSAGTRRDLLLNDSSARFFSANEEGLPVDVLSRTNALALADFDLDGDLDILTANDEAWPSSSRGYFQNVGFGRFKDVSESLLPNAATVPYDVAVGDVDGDGRPDAVFAEFRLLQFLLGFQNQLLLGSPGGKLVDASSRLPQEQDLSVAVELADFDGDGDLDLLVANVYAPHKLYKNDGTGHFTTFLSIPWDLAFPTSLTSGDIDGDGDVDLIMGQVAFVDRFGHPDRLFINDGTGNLQEDKTGRIPSAKLNTRGTALADLDGDGDLDLVLATGIDGIISGERNQVLSNNGTGRFLGTSTLSLPGMPGVSLSVAVADFDHDGDQDILFGDAERTQGNTYAYGQNLLYLNDGAGKFSNQTSAWLPRLFDGPYALAVGDMDQDGDIDVVLGENWFGSAFGGDGQTRIYANQIRHLHVPLTARLGGLVELDLSAQQAGIQPGLALLLISGAPQSPALEIPSIGILQLDPSKLLSLPAATFTTVGTLRLGIQVPAQAGLVGVTVHAQAVVGHSDVGPFRLTNAVSFTLLR